MFTAICPQCRKEITGPSEQDAMKDYSWHWLLEHDVPPGQTFEPPAREED